MPDCCVLYTAQHQNAAIATFDDKLAARAADLGLTLVNQPVTVTLTRTTCYGRTYVPATMGGVRVDGPAGCR